MEMHLFKDSRKGKWMFVVYSPRRVEVATMHRSRRRAIKYAVSYLEGLL